MEHVAKDALLVGVRPLLADPTLASDNSAETLIFGAPGRISPDVPYGKLWFDFNEDGTLAHFSVPFENVGSGVAGVSSARVVPNPNGDVYVSRKFVPVGALLRVNVSVLHPNTDTEQFQSDRWAVNGVLVHVDYTSSYDGEKFTATADIRQYATQDPFVQSITIASKDGTVVVSGQSLY
jgi:hypothetical protein